MSKRIIDFLAATTVMVSSASLSTSAKAAYLLKYEEVGPNVVAEGSGSVDLIDLNRVGSTEIGSCFGVLPSQGLACVGPLSIPGDTYQGFAGPTSFGLGGLQLATSGSGDFTGIVPLPGNLHPPGGYVSGDALFGELTFANTDFQGLGLTPGVYVWSWGAGRHADTFKVQIGVPEPSTWALLLAGFAGLGFFTYRRTRKGQGRRLM